MLMDQPTEPISPHDPDSRRQANWFAGPKRRYQPQGAVRAEAVVVIDVLGQHRPQLPAPEDQRPIMQFTPNGPYPPLGACCIEPEDADEAQRGGGPPHWEGAERDSNHLIWPGIAEIR